MFYVYGVRNKNMAEQRTIPVKPSTRNDVRALKGERTYEEFISEVIAWYAEADIDD